MLRSLWVRGHAIMSDIAIPFHDPNFSRLLHMYEMRATFSFTNTHLLVFWGLVSHLIIRLKYNKFKHVCMKISKKKFWHIVSKSTDMVLYIRSEILTYDSRNASRCPLRNTLLQTVLELYFFPTLLTQTYRLIFDGYVSSIIPCTYCPFTLKINILLILSQRKETPADKWL